MPEPDDWESRMGDVEKLYVLLLWDGVGEEWVMNTNAEDEDVVEAMIAHLQMFATRHINWEKP